MSDLGIIGPCFRLNSGGMGSIYLGYTTSAFALASSCTLPHPPGPVDCEICGSKPSSLPKTKSLLKMSLQRRHEIMLPPQTFLPNQPQRRSITGLPSGMRPNPGSGSFAYFFFSTRTTRPQSSPNNWLPDASTVTSRSGEQGILRVSGVWPLASFPVTSVRLQEPPDGLKAHRIYFPLSQWMVIASVWQCGNIGDLGVDITPYRWTAHQLCSMPASVSVEPHHRISCNLLFLFRSMGEGRLGSLNPT